MALKLVHYLQRFYGFSRRKAFRLIRKGKVKVDGHTVDQPLYEVEEGADVEVEGYNRGGRKRTDYVLFNKPPGYVVSRDDPFNPTIYSLLPPEFYDLKAVGRLDKPSEGLLILTNDGLLIHRLTHPKYGVPRGYMVKVEPPPDGRLVGMCLRGVWDRGELLRATRVEIRGGGWLFVELRQGKYREIRRMMRRAGRKVSVLRRVVYGPITLDVPRGRWRFLKEEEVEALRRTVGIEGPP